VCGRLAILLPLGEATGEQVVEAGHQLWEYPNPHRSCLRDTACREVSSGAVCFRRFLQVLIRLFT
jgi:hypothetical protein